ncbi:dienelactone hydrolase family protein [Glutamicibacter sp. MNS18]|uniref:alpha/beta hydrolase family protein n=1 Tax=Glutamicibacter sp. MNS18 TaxID=2989817 RepID=UPI0022358F44|nr:alpha/beta family hydrolase [Glutamicibacter sp. MNS18]MCW4465853.1 dienelactone hydrolase family protein [Glutamicibacter sp. MNS18]
MMRSLLIPFEDSTLTALWNPAPDARAVLVLAHGAGAGKDHPFLTGVTQALQVLGLSVLRFNFPYMDIGKKFPDRAPRALQAWNAVLDMAEGQLADGLPVFAAGKSFGGRMASLMVAEGRDVPGLVFLGYPLHAPKKTEKLRDEHLYGLDTPLLFLQGTKDPFAQPEILQPIVDRLGARAQLHWVEGGDHSFKSARSGRSVEEDGAQLAAPVADFVDSVL